MNELRRPAFRDDGIFGELWFDGDTYPFSVTLEHSYNGQPKLPAGIYRCVRGQHALHNGVPFETFEITGVAGHSAILFHAGNYNRDSEGCVLLGREIVNAPDGSEMITGSRLEFHQFMARLEGIDEFELKVI